MHSRNLSLTPVKLIEVKEKSNASSGGALLQQMKCVDKKREGCWLNIWSINEGCNFHLHIGLSRAKLHQNTHCSIHSPLISFTGGSHLAQLSQKMLCRAPLGHSHELGKQLHVLSLLWAIKIQKKTFMTKSKSKNLNLRSK